MVNAIIQINVLKAVANQLIKMFELRILNPGK
jgi:hypothetical protein